MTELSRRVHSLTAGAILGLAGCSTPQPTPDLILHGAFVWTVDESHPVAQAVAVRGEQVLAVGSEDAILGLAGPETRILDLDGAMVLPGFNDSHVHAASAARFLEFNVMRVSSQEEFVKRVEEVVAELEAGEWILGGFWGAYDDWAPDSAGATRRERFRPSVRAIEEQTRAHPLFIRRFDGTEFAANRAALHAAGLDPDDPVAAGVRFERDGQGRPTGIMAGEGVLPLFEAVVPREFSRERRRAQTLRALAEAARFGVTSMSDMSDDEQLAIWRDLRASGELTARIHFRPHLERWAELEEDGIGVGSGDEWIRLGAVKGHIDGIMGTRSARFYEPYDDDPDNRGRWRRLMVDENGHFVEGQFVGHMARADAANIQLTVHAIGDEANGLLCDYLEELERRNGARDRRFRLVHAQVVAPADLARMGRLGIIAEVQPFHLSDDMRWMEERIGRQRCRQAYAFRSLADHGAILCFGSDWPGTSAAEYPINPLLGLYAAVTRQTLRGEPAGGWFPEERITMDEAIRASTWAGAYASYEENIKGSLAPGMRADLAVLSQNLLEVPPERILETEVLLTLVAGRVVYEKRAR